MTALLICLGIVAYIFVAAAVAGLAQRREAYRFFDSYDDGIVEWIIGVLWPAMIVLVPLALGGRFLFRKAAGQ